MEEITNRGLVDRTRYGHQNEVKLFVWIISTNRYMRTVLAFFCEALAYVMIYPQRLEKARKWSRFVLDGRDSRSLVLPPTSYSLIYKI